MKMWPTKLDLTKPECRGQLRQLELDAYSSVVSTFRAQGSLDNGKSTLLEQLRKVFHINQDRHKAEIRRVANDEKLKTIAELLNGKSYDLEWNKEGHRTYPLIARAPPSTALKTVADHAAIDATHENSKLPAPSDTKRGKALNDEVPVTKPIITKDPTLPPPSQNIVGLSKKELKRSFMEGSVSKKQRASLMQQYRNVLPTPNQKIRQLYNSFQGKKPRKTHKKQSKAKAGKYAGLQSPPMPGPSNKMSNARMMHSYASSGDEIMLGGEELHKHLTSQQVMLPPPPPNQQNSQNNYYKAQQPQLSPQHQQYAPILPTSKKDVASNLIKMNSQLEPQPHYIPNMSRMKGENVKQSSKMPKNLMPAPMYPPSMQPMGSPVSPTSQILHNTLKAPKGSNSSAKGGRTNNFDHIPDPKIIFSMTSSSAKMNPNENIIVNNNNSNNIMRTPVKMEESLDSLGISDSSPTSSLQLLSQAASAIPKLKIAPQMPVKSVASVSTPVPSTSSSISTSANKNNIKIIPTNKRVFLQSVDQSINIKKPGVIQGAQPYQNAKLSAANLKKVQLLINNATSGTGNKTQHVIIANKAGNNSMNNVYTIGGKAIVGSQPYTVISGENNKQQKVIVQSIDQKYVPLATDQNAPNQSGNANTTGNNENIVVLKVNHENQYNIIDNQLISGGSAVVPRNATDGASEFASNSPVITEDTPIDILPATVTIPTQSNQTPAASQTFTTTTAATPLTTKLAQNNFQKVQVTNIIKPTSGTATTSSQQTQNITTATGAKQFKFYPFTGGSFQNIKISGINLASGTTLLDPKQHNILKNLKGATIVPSQINFSKISNSRIKISKNIGGKTVTILPQTATQAPQTSASSGIIIHESIQVAPVQLPSPAPDKSNQKKNPNVNNPTTDWEQELDNENRTKITKPVGKAGTKNSHPPSGTAKNVKKLKVTQLQPETQDTSPAIVSLDTATTTTTSNQGQKEDSSETNNNVYDTSNLVIYDNSMNTNENIIIESVEQIIADPESLQEDDDPRLIGDQIEQQIIIMSPEEIIERDGKEDSPQKINGQFVEETIEELDKSDSYTYQDLVKSIQDEDEFQDEPRVSSSSDDLRQVLVEEENSFQRPLTDSNSFDEFMAATTLVANDIISSDGDGSESTSSQQSQQQSQQHQQIQLKNTAPKIQSIE